MYRTARLANRTVLTSLPILIATATATLASGTIETILDKLETRLFSHVYVQDTENQRVARLERFVFGQPSAGSLDARIDRLASAVVDLNAAKDTATVAQANKIDSGNRGTTNRIKPYHPVQPVTEAVNYPRVNRLEMSMLGRTYGDEPVKTRLARLETKAFGTASSSDDLSARVDKLNSYAGIFDVTDSENGAQPTLNDLSSLLRTSGSFYGSGRKGTLGQQLALLEMIIFGKASMQVSLLVRIKRLEDTLLPSEERTNKLGLAERVTRLSNIVEGESLSSIEQANREPGCLPDLIEPAVATNSVSQVSSAVPVAAQNNTQNSGKSSIFKKIAHGLLAVGKALADDGYGNGGYGWYGGNYAGYYGNPYGNGYGIGYGLGGGLLNLPPNYTPVNTYSPPGNWSNNTAYNYGNY